MEERIVNTLVNYLIVFAFEWNEIGGCVWCAFVVRVFLCVVCIDVCVCVCVFVWDM